MDSLLIVLVVIGIVMILAGVARMRSNKKHQNWDDIDHNVLFSKSGEEAAEANVMESSVIEPNAGEEVGKARPVGAAIDSTEHFSAAEKLEPAVTVGMQADIDEEDRQAHQHAAKPALQERASSILNKIKGEPEKEELLEEAPTLIRAYSKEAPDHVIAINVMAHEGLTFEGERLVAAIENLGLRFGEMDIFHFQDGGETQFSLVNMVKPGVFDMNTLAQLRTPGVSLFFQLPCELSNGMDVFEKMLSTAQRLADALNGEVRDETRSVLTLSAIDLQKQKISEYNMKWMRSA